MKQNVEEVLDELRDITLEVKSDASGVLGNSTAQGFTHKPSADQWSAAECLEHLNLYGDFYLTAIESAITRASGKYPPRKHYRSGLLGGSFSKSMRLKNGQVAGRRMKSPADKNPHNSGLRSDLLLAFLDQQETYLKLIEAARNVDVSAVRVPISIARFIRLNLADVLKVVVYHNQRHMEQAKRAIKGQKSLFQ